MIDNLIESLLKNDKADFTEDIYITEIMSVFPPSHDDIDSTRKYILPYIKHNPEDVIIARDKFIKYVGKCLNTKYYNNINLNIFEERNAILDTFGILSDSCNPGFYTVWYRFACMDDEFREWSFVPSDLVNLDHSKSTCLNEVDEVIKKFYRHIVRDNIINSILG
jgi:hypothetical protein